MEIASSISGSSSSDDDSDKKKKEEASVVYSEPSPVDELPQLSEEEMKLLVKNVQAFTTLCNLKQEDWTSGVESIIQSYFEEHNAVLLTIYYNEFGLQASLVFPREPVHDVMYFLKDPMIFITPQNFHQEIRFGSVGDSIEGSMLNVLELVYAPVFFNMTTWPDSVKSDFCTHMHNFLSNLTGIHYKKLGLTVIYVPTEGINLPVDVAAKDKELVKRLEGVVVYWTRQIRVALGDVVQSTPQDELFPTDEYEFWIYRYENLAGLNFQLQNENLKHITVILQMTQSTYMQQFLKLIEEIENAMRAAKSNIEFLQILNKPCKTLESVKDPLDIPAHLPDIMQLFRVIWINAPYYNSSEQISGLFKALSNQVITQCRASVILPEIFLGNTVTGIRQLNSCISCLEKYKSLYEKISISHEINPKVAWVLDKGVIFNHVDTFIQRCNDMVDVCHAMIVFGRMNEEIVIPKPQFGGTHGPDFEQIFAKVERDFMQSLYNIEEVQNTILDVQASSWHDDILQFRNSMKVLEVIVENMTNAVFDMVTTVEEGLETLQTIYYFAKRDTFRPLFDRKTVYIYKIFGEEIQSAKKDLVGERMQFPACMPYYAGRAMMARMKKKRLVRLMKLVDGAQWMSYCGIGEEVRLQYDKLIKSIDDTMRELFYKWVDLFNEDLDKHMSRPLMCRSTSHPGLLECNFDRTILNVQREAKYWRLMKFPIPKNVMKIYKKRNMTHFLYESVLTVVMDYNRIITSLSDDERLLFRELIKVCNKKINPGLLKLQWNTEVSDVYISDCLTYTTELQEFVDDFKNSNLEVSHICEKICDTSMIYVDTREPYKLEVLHENLDKHRKSILVVLVNLYQDIIKCLIIIYEGFEEHIEMMGGYWAQYIQRMDNMVEEAFRLCIKRSLNVMLEVLHGDGTTGPSPLISISSTLKKNRITFEPSIMEVGKIVQNVMPSLVDSMSLIPRLCEKFHIRTNNLPFYKVVQDDEDCKKLQELLNKEVLFTVQHFNDYLKSWDSFRNMWEVNKDMFISRYKKLKPSATAFDADISRYTEVANSVQMMETVSFMHFVIIDSSELKSAIVGHCMQWQDKLMKLLLHIASEMLKDVYEYIKKNTEEIQKEPTNLDQLQHSMKLYEQLMEDVPVMEKKFPVIQDYFDIIGKYEMAVPVEVQEDLDGMDEAWKEYLHILTEAGDMVERHKERFRTGLLDSVEVFKKDAFVLLENFLQNGPFSSDWKAKDALNYLNDLREQVAEMHRQEEQLRKDLALFGISLPENPELAKLEKDLNALELVWELTNQWDEAWSSYKTGAFWTIETEEMENMAQTLFRKLTRLCRELKDKNWEIVEYTRASVDAFRRTLPLLSDLKNQAMRERHWEQVKKIMNVEFDQNSPDFTLDAIMQMNFQKYADDINEISNAATMELQIETGLKAIADTWNEIILDMMPHHKKEGVYRLKAVDEIFTTLEDNQVSLSTMKSTRFVEPFAKEVDYWERTLSTIMEVLELILAVQRQWLYLENIFIGEDIRKQLPKETDDFDKVTANWKEITSRMYQDRNAKQATHFPGLWVQLNKINNSLELIQKALEKYMETKRHIFPRFYFISNDDLLEILAQSKKPELVQPHLKKLFDNINKIKIQKLSPAHKYEALGMFSADAEYIDFSSLLILDGPVELWLCELENMMRLTLRDQLKLCRAALRKNLAKRDKWIKDWPGQMCITSSQMQWTTDCTRALVHTKMLETRHPLKKLRKKQNLVLVKFSDAIRGNLTKIQRLKVVALVTIEIHARDVIEKMYKTNCMDVSAFEWLSQLRFYWDRDIDDCIIRQTNTYFVYGYEYLGNSGRLVITPLTDRCYITLTTALHLHRGGSPKGPAGTGKTETVKDLGKSLGSYVIVVNCSEGLDYKSMGRMFSGLAQTGAWGCFDEFNRINIEVLSVVAQQILSILSALSTKVKRFIFEGTEINLVHSCGIFITMNPGYAGRTELPDNLKSMFRPISMIVPDSAMISEIILFGEGFHETRLLAKKVYTLYCLAMQQLSKQDHYDFGLRGLVALLRYAGRKRRAFPNLPDDEVVLLAMKDMNVAKLTSDDLPLFNGITSDLFPGVETPVIDYEELSTAVNASFREGGLQCIPTSVIKVIQLYETKNSRHSVMIVGKTGSGKTATWKTLQNTLSLLRKQDKPGYNYVKEFPINPKALALGELYGEFNLSTNEWQDGVLSAIMRTTCADESPDEKWIVFDGPVDAVWIENMNSVMDDNKVLTLINSERITMPEQVSLLFEVEDLAVASPATVSRCGMVYNDYKDLGWKPYVESWLQRQPIKEIADEMRRSFDHYINPLLEFKHLNCEMPVPIAEISELMSLCKLLDCMATKKNGLDPSDEESFLTLSKMWFLFCMIWSICATVDEGGRRMLDTYIRGIESIFPLKQTVYEYYVDVRTRSLVLWEDKLSDQWKLNKNLPFFKMIVPTVDTVRYQFLISALLTRMYPGLMVGPVGTGKTSTIHTVLEALDPLKYTILMINMSAQTTSNNVQDIIESRVEKRTKGVYVPPGGKTMITFMDDLNMPAKEVYGAQPPLELIRQWIDYGFWYDRQKQWKKHVKDMILLAAMGPPGGGRNFITGRLMSRFNVINMTFPSEEQITRIFGSMLSQQLLDFDEEPKYLAGKITAASIDLYNTVIEKMLPTPTKIHYLFNLRDISKIFQGLLRSTKETQYTKGHLLRLWVHECFRVFSDRLIDEKDQEWFVDQMNKQLGRHFELTFHNLCPEKESPVFAHFVNPHEIYEDLEDIQLLRKYLEGQLEEYNASPGVVNMDLVLFKDAILHICRIVRVISQPRGNMMLVGIGGSGRQSLARISSYICEYNIFQIEVLKHYRAQEFREDLKTLYHNTGVDMKPTAFLFNDTQIVDEVFLEIINNMLSSGEVPNLYKPEEFEEVKNQLAVAAAKKHIHPTSEAMFSFLIDRVRTNLYIILCMSPVGDAFRNRLRQYPSLVNCTTIDWFMEWPQEALLEVANKYLAGVNFVETIRPPSEKTVTRLTAPNLILVQEQLRIAVASIFATIHDSVSKFSKKMLLEMKRYNYVTPTNYLELVAGYKEMLDEKRLKIKTAENKLRNGLFKIDDTRVKVEVMSEELEVATVKVAEYQQQCDEYLVIIVTQKREADEQQKSVAIRKIRIEEEEITCKKLAAVAQADLDEAMPALEEAMRALDALNKRDLTEVKSYGRPPPKVEMVMEAVMVLKQVEPTWAEAKRQLGESTFLNQLRDFDKDNISDRTLKKIAVYTNSEEFDPEKVGIVSFAAKSLCMWVIAIEKYGKIFRIVKPKKDKLDDALNTLKMKQEALAAAEAKLLELSEYLARLQKEYDQKLEQKEELRKKAEILAQKLERARALVEGLSGERARWEQTVEDLDSQFDVLPGDCLVATGFVSYMGPFLSQYREELVTLWKKCVNANEVPCSQNFSVVTFLSDPTTIREWNIQGLPSDDFSTENGIIVNRCSRWPLLIDPQCQGMEWIKKMEGEKDLNVIDFGQTDFMKTLENSIQFGKPVLLQNVMEVLEPSLAPILNKSIVKQGGQTMIKLSDKMIQYNSSFRFFITTKLGNPHYAPEVSTKTTLVNFAVKQQGLEAQLLGIVVRKEKPQLEEQKDKLVLNIAAGKRILIDLEDELLRLLYETKGSLLDDLQLLITLQTSQTTSVAITEQLSVAEITEVEIDLAREGYRPCATRASILFFVLNDMSQIDPMYQFSLDSYNRLFLSSIEKSKKTEHLEDRIIYLNEYHTYAMYRNTCRGLFEHHKLLFSFHMCMKILEAEGKVSLIEYNYLLKGGVVLDREEQMDNPCPGWLSDVAWDNITELDKLPGFHGVTDSFEQHSREWHAWYTNKQPEEQPLIGEWDDITTKFQKMLFVRSLRPDRISFCVTTFVVNILGQRFVEPPVLDIKAVLEDSTARSPLIFVLSPGVDPASSLTQLAEVSGMAAKFQTLSLGQGQAPIATRLIKVGAKEGNWVFLANCHLSLSWMPKLDKIVELLQTSKVNNTFRLWLSSSPHPDFPISILQAGIKMTTEPPKGLKANLKRLYQLLTEAQFTACGKAIKYKRLLFSLCFFHAILLERKKFQQLGWNVIYSFNDSDFEVSENLLAIYLDEYVDTPWDALKYLIAGVNYGGHVTDDWDRRLLTTYINLYFHEDVLNTNFYRLSSLPTYYTPRDGSQQSYMDYITVLPNIDAPEAFGQHSNADITSLISDTKMMFETLMSMQLQVSVSEGESKEEQVMQLAADVLHKLPQVINIENTQKLIGSEKSPLDVVLIQEITRYDALLVSIKLSLEELQKGIKGLVVMSSELENIFICIFEGRVPQPWLKVYPSMKLLGSWTRDLVLRVEHFAEWAATTHPPVLFWLSAYTFPTGLLTAILQTSARKANISIDSLSWEFIVFQKDDYISLEMPMDGVYVRGLFLEGAGWNPKTMSLTEPQPMQLVCPMPFIHFKPMEQLKKKTKGIYICPCYYYPQRCGGAGRESYVVAVDLKSGTETSDHWIKRGTALLLSLAT